jgi:hypothetical protein
MRAGSAADAAGVRARSASRVMAARERMANLGPIHALGSWGNFWGSGSIVGLRC